MFERHALLVDESTKKATLFSFVYLVFDNLVEYTS